MSPNSDRPLKRVRTLSGSGSELPPGSSSPRTLDSMVTVGLKRDDEFWLEDGNLVLVARDTAFRVYRSLLASQSTVFADMFASSSPKADELYQGCPVVKLSDSPEDLRYFLRVLLPVSQPIFYHDDALPDFTFHQISAVIRLSHKYHVPGVQRQAVASLKDCLKWDCCDGSDDSDDTEPEVTEDPAYTIDAINLARLLDLPAIIPTALLVCCSIGSKVMDGWKREDGHVEHLTPEDLKRCIDGRDALAREALPLLLSIFSLDPCTDCASRQRCRSALVDIREEALRHPTACHPNLLTNWGPFITQHTKGARLCGNCERELLKRNDRYRKRIWNHLPSFFDLPMEGWEKKGDDGDTAE